MQNLISSPFINKWSFNIFHYPLFIYKMHFYRQKLYDPPLAATAEHQNFSWWRHIDKCCADTIFLFANMNSSLNMISPIWFPYLDCSYFSFWNEMNEIKIVSYSFSSSVIEYNSNEKLLKQGSLLQKSSLCLIMMWWKLDTVETNCMIFILYTKIKSTQKA